MIRPGVSVATAAAVVRPLAAAPLTASRYGGSAYLTRGAGLTGSADGDKLLFAAAVKFTGGDDTVQTFVRSNQGKVHIYRQASNLFRATVRDTANAVVCDLIATTALTADGSFHHIMVSVDNSGGVARGFLAIDGTLEDDDVLANNVNIDWTAGDWGFMARHDGTEAVQADVQALYLDDHYEATVTDFYNSGVVDLGSAADGPSGSSPMVWLENGRTQAGTGGALAATGTVGAIAGVALV